MTRQPAELVTAFVTGSNAALVLCQCINVYARADIINHLNPETCIARILLCKMTWFNANVSPYEQGWIIMERMTPPTTPVQEQSHSVSSSQIVSPTQLLSKSHASPQDFRLRSTRLVSKPSKLLM